jgi:hypothetical protein
MKPHFFGRPGISLASVPNTLFLRRVQTEEDFLPVGQDLKTGGLNLGDT